ncbi:universal stress protein [Deferribacterales bacterium RsTz2092]|nr:universal stress protein [Deferribacterales bacterium]
MQVKKIICPTDFSDASRKAMDYAIYMQNMFNAELVIVHVVFDESSLITMYVPQATMHGFLAEMQVGAQGLLDEFLTNCEQLKGVKYTTKLLKGSPHEELLKYADEISADMIVIGTNGRTGIEHALFGSTAEKVVSRAKCPVLTVRPD